MSEHPLNLAFRFLLELVALAALGFWGWWLGQGAPSFVLVLLLPAVAAYCWATFRVPGDGPPPRIKVSGPVRLLIEATVFGGAVGGLIDGGHATLATILGMATIFHYLLSHDRVRRLLHR